MPAAARVALLAFAAAVAATGVGAAAVLDVKAGYYECPSCHAVFVPTMAQYVKGLHTLTRSRQDDESAGSGSCYTKNGDLTDHKEADLTLLPLYRQPPHVVQSRYGIVGLAVGNGGFYVKTDQPTTNYRPLPKTFP